MNCYKPVSMLRPFLRLFFRTAIALSAIAICVPTCQTVLADDWIDLIGKEVSANWLSDSPDHWKVGGAVSLARDQPGRLELKPGIGLLFAPGVTKNPEANIPSKRHFGDLRLEVEFLIPGGSNSGIYLMGRYELQIKDSFGKAPLDSHDCGAIYPRWDEKRGSGQEGYEGHIPRVNACKPPGEWQSYDVEFRAPRFDSAGKKIEDALFVSVKQNGIEIHSNVSLTGPTRGAPFETESATGPLLLQGDHGPIAFRRLRVLEQPSAPTNPAGDSKE